ncbi:sugar transferase [Herbaspirillum sp. BH-1]|uniref:HAD superfamily hydrolase (TIGR01509 family) n=1 Tax=Herbaspirillum frisingense TaxID=92645 RepID=A0ABU1PMB2_9BURK|nr:MULTISPECIES: HAD-IA family hydrolase [Herbaspirillum]MDR6586278.1 HAD superfamily hydrolase (TIGR01509 family) [Herbaspirillum frisingense]PLY57773.1 sugar transferase [Herbaspirillum sp. BH-1]
MNDSTLTPELVIFDCDGTLVDSEVVAARAWSEYVANYGVSLSAEEALARFRGVSMKWCISHIEQLHGQALPAHFEEELRALMGSLLEQHLQPISGAVEMLEKLHLPFALASNAPHHKIELCLRVTGLLPHFAGRIFSAYDVQRWKPDPALFLFAAERLGVPPQRCAVVEDSLPGVQAGLAAGMKVIALQEHAPHPELPAGVAIITHLGQLHAQLA